MSLSLRMQNNQSVFGLYVDGLEKHLLETADFDAPTLKVLVPLLLYADLHVYYRSGTSKAAGCTDKFL